MQLTTKRFTHSHSYEQTNKYVQLHVHMYKMYMYIVCDKDRNWLNITVKAARLYKDHLHKDHAPISQFPGSSQAPYRQSANIKSP